MIIKHDDPKPMGCSKSSSKREVYSYTSLPQEARKISDKQSNLTPYMQNEKERVIENSGTLNWDDRNNMAPLRNKQCMRDNINSILNI